MYSMKDFFKKAAASVSIAMLLMPVAVFAQVGFNDTTNLNKPEGYFNFAGANNATGAIGGGDPYKLPGVAKQDPRAIVTNIISIISGFLGIIAVVIILISGFQWMTAGGDEEAVKTAQKRLVQAVIGLILILSTWSVAYYVVNTLGKTIFQ